jgi:hypothetical protein
MGIDCCHSRHLQYFTVFSECRMIVVRLRLDGWKSKLEHKISQDVHPKETATRNRTMTMPLSASAHVIASSPMPGSLSPLQGGKRLGSKKQTWTGNEKDKMAKSELEKPIR